MKLTAKLHTSILILGIFGVLLCGLLDSTNGHPAPSFMDSLPIISQFKSLVQVIGGDAEAAKQTQINFSRQNFVAGHVRSLVEVASGNHEAAKETKKQLWSTVEAQINGFPVVGHIKGAVHYAVGDRETGDEIMKSASRTAGVMLAGTAGFFAGGPPGAVAGGVSGGAIMDGIITGIESAIHKEYKPSGTINGITEIIKKEASVGEIFDTVGGVAGDALSGYGVGRFLSLKSSKKKSSSRASLLRCRRGAGGVKCGYGAPQPVPGLGTPPVKPLAPKAPVIAVPAITTAIAAGTSSDVTRTADGLGTNPVKPLAPKAPAIAVPAITTAIAAGTSSDVTRTADDETKKKAADSEEKGKEKEEEEEEEEEKEEDEKCRDEPGITKRDVEKMRKCLRKKVGEECRVQCERDYEPSVTNIKCISNGAKKGVWDLNGAKCEYNVDVVCRDQFNRQVDWFIMYRIPKKADTRETLARGSSYLYMSSESVQPNWQIVQTHDPLSQTLNPIRSSASHASNSEESGEPLKYLFYNDQPPTGTKPSSRIYGHAKGVLAQRANNGFLLTHSQPSFPNEDGSLGSHSSFGQIFLCVSLTGHQVERARRHVDDIRGYIYKESMQKVEMEHRLTWFLPKNLALLSSKNGNTFTLFSKNENDVVEPGKDIWSGIIQQYYRKHMLVMSWRSGNGGKMPSYCPRARAFEPDPLYLEDITSAQLGSPQALSWTRTQEHAKWGITKDCDTFCISDMNRMYSQMERYGGAVCLQIEGVAAIFKSLIFETECGRFIQ